MNHPAAEIVAIALRKIVKLAPKKHTDLFDDAKIFLDNMHTIIPVDGSEGQIPRSSAAAAAAAPLPSFTSVSAASQSTHADGSDRPGSPPSAAGTAAPEQQQQQQQQQQPSEESATSSSPLPPSADSPTQGAPPVVSHPAAADILAQATEDAALDTAPESAAATHAQASQDAAMARESASSAAPTAALDYVDDGQPAAPSAAAAAAPAAAAASAPAEPDAGGGLGAAPPPPALVPRTDMALRDEMCDYIIRLMTLAVDTQKPQVVEVALDCIQKLIAFRFLQGSCYAISISEKTGREEGQGIKAMDLSSGTPQAHTIELMCRCDEIPDEGVELQILKGLLTAATSTTFTIHGQALLLVVRTCYNIFLMSRSEINQTTAKASLTQMLNVVFQRMEAQSVHIDIRPIIVTEVLVGQRANNAQDLGMSSSVQAFLNSVVMVSAQQGNVVQTPSELRSSVAGAFHGKLAQAVIVSKEVESDDEHEQFSLGGVAQAGGTAVGGTPAAAGGTAPATPTSTAANAVHRHQPSASFSDAGADGNLPLASEGAPSFSGVVTVPVGVGAVLQKDAFLVFRALCKLSIRTTDTATLTDPTAVRGKVLALELLKVLLENSGPEFRNSEKFTSAIRQYLCLSLLKNSASSLPAALQLSGSIFLTLLMRFRTSLKAEIGVFFPMILLKPFEYVASGPMSGTPGAQHAAASAPGVSAANSLSHKVATLKLVNQVCSDGQLLVDLFVNYDCDLESSNMFERLVNGLVKLAQQPVQVVNSMGVLPTMTETHNWQMETALRGDALRTLVALVDAMWRWYKTTSGLDAMPMRDEASEQAAEDERAAARSSETPHTLESTASILNASMVDEASAAIGTGANSELGAKRAYKMKFQESIALFNKKPRKGIELLQKEGMLGPTPEDVARFLAKQDQGLDKVTIGDYLGEREDFSLKVMHAYVDDMEFADMEFDAAIRKFLSGFRLPGEAQKIDRLMEKFAERYRKCNPNSFKSADVAYVLAYSVIMLNTDAHNPQVKVKMSKEGFLKNNRGINDGQDLDPEFMSALYDRIVHNEIKMKDGDIGTVAAGGTGGGAAGGQYSYNIMQTLLSLVGATRKEVSSEPSDESVRRTLEYLHERAKSSTLVSATEADAVRPMMELVWAPLLGVLSVLFDEYTDERMITLCLRGFTAGCCLTAQVGMDNLRDIFINSLCNFTHLHSPATMKYKNALAFKYMLKVAEAVGDHLSERWVDVLRCISRWELLQQIASGMPTDAVLFSAPPEQGRIKAASAAAIGSIEKGLKKLSARKAPEEIKSMDSLAMNEMSIRRVHIGGSGSKGVGEMGMSIHVEVINSVDSHDMNRPFLDSWRLDSEAIVAFVRAMTAISLDELRDVKAPRIFSLTKIVEIAHFNMTRIRLVWTRIWNVLSQYFIQVGCHTNLSVAMYAVDSLRQLAMKFLERDELANYTFQNDFLRPFVVVMRQSQAVEIRELIIRCLSQMVLARVTNVKSGWKSMFMVFTTAAGDRDPMIVRLAFHTIEKIVREHFDHITETETTTFTDCVNCLIAFTNNPHSLNVALNSIAFLRFCSAKLAEGAIGDVDALPEGSVMAFQPQRVVAIEHFGDQSSSFQPEVPQAPMDPSSASASGSALAALAGSEENRGTVAAAISVAATAADALSQAADSQPGSTSGKPHPERHVRFIDRDEHVYFWFPLLAGLSELTFDPRQEIRHGALGVLFDTLKHHGGTFAASFWRRIFDSVLLPIFDHVRAEVTDTTTFTSEKKRQQEEAWLYETCTKCLQHLVDIYVQFHTETNTLLASLLELLRGFMNRSHQSLAAVGVAAFVRLVTKAGVLLKDEEWEEVMRSLTALVEEISPCAWDIVIAPQQRPTNNEIQPCTSGTETLAPASSGVVPRNYTLREGMGSRRLLKFRCQASVQLLLVQGCSEIYSHMAGIISGGALLVMLNVLDSIAHHARKTNTDTALRRQLAVQQAVDHVPEDKMVQDPPLLRLEAEASHAYLSVLMHMSLGSLAPIALAETTPNRPISPDVVAAATDRLVRLCASTLERFTQNGRGGGGGGAGSHDDDQQQQQLRGGGSEPGMAAGGTGSGTARQPPDFARQSGGGAHEQQQQQHQHPQQQLHHSASMVAGRTQNGLRVLLCSPAAEYAAFAPLLTSVLSAMAVFHDTTFNANLQELFPLMTRLISAEHAPPEVLRALALLFNERIGPLLGVAPGTGQDENPHAQG